MGTRLLVFVPLLTTAACSPLPPIEPPEPTLAHLERQMVALINETRRHRGLSELRHDPTLAGLARAHSEDMRLHDFLGHRSRMTGGPDARVDRAGIDYVGVAENVARDRTVAAAHKRLMASPRHRANTLEPRFSDIGVGIVQDSSGWLHVTQVFVCRSWPDGGSSE